MTPAPRTRTDCHAPPSEAEAEEVLLLRLGTRREISRALRLAANRVEQGADVRECRELLAAAGAWVETLG